MDLFGGSGKEQARARGNVAEKCRQYARWRVTSAVTTKREKNASKQMHRVATAVYTGRNACGLGMVMELAHFATRMTAISSIKSFIRYRAGGAVIIRKCLMARSVLLNERLKSYCKASSVRHPAKRSASPTAATCS